VIIEGWQWRCCTMPKQKRITTEEAEELLGGGSLLDRIGRAKMAEQPMPARETELQTKKDEPNPVIKVSLYLSSDEIDALDAQIIKRRKQTGRSPRRTHLIREAIDVWLSQQD
jgi:hypothetical protein